MIHNFHTLHYASTVTGCDYLAEWFRNKMDFRINLSAYLMKAGTEQLYSQHFTHCLVLPTLGCSSVWISRRSSWFITHSPSKPCPFSPSVTHIQTNQQHGQRLSHFTQPRRRLIAASPHWNAQRRSHSRDFCPSFVSLRASAAPPHPPIAIR